MKGRLLAATMTTIALMLGAANAQDKAPASSTANNQGSVQQTHNNNQTAQNLPQEIKDKLKSQGFTNVQVVPGSFLVSAKDKDGDPVNMVLGPHSMTMFTMISPDERSTTGSAGGSSQNNQPKK